MSGLLRRRDPLRLTGRPRRPVRPAGRAGPVSPAGPGTGAPDGVRVMNYTDLVRGAAHAPFEGWDFGVFAGRFTEEKPSWDFAELVRARLADGDALLDPGTGGDEFLSGLTPLPPGTTATESCPPHVPVARRRLAPLGARVIDTSDEDDDLLPLPDAAFGLVTSRHGSVRTVLLLLRVTPWQIPDFDAGRYDTRLRAPHTRPSFGRPLTVRCHRFVITARRPLMS
ncbi:class I SAM-dependent methyltransferase [Streptomyces scopuliridis]